MSAPSERSLLARQLRRGKVKGPSKQARNEKRAEGPGSGSSASSSDSESDGEETERKPRVADSSETLDVSPGGRQEDGAVEDEVGDEMVSDADLKAMGIESFVSKRGNLCFRVSATPSRGPFMSIASCLDYMQGKYYLKVTKEMQRLLDPQAPPSSKEKKTKGRGNRSKAAQQVIDAKRKSKRKARNSSLTEEQIAAKKAKFARKKARREARKAAGIGPQGRTVFEN